MHEICKWRASSAGFQGRLVWTKVCCLPECSFLTKVFPTPYHRVWSPGREMTSLTCVFLLHLLPVVFGCVGLEPKLTYGLSRPIRSTRARGYICVFVPDSSSFARWRWHNLGELIDSSADLRIHPGRDYTRHFLHAATLHPAVQIHEAFSLNQTKPSLLLGFKFTKPATCADDNITEIVLTSYI